MRILVISNLIHDLEIPEWKYHNWPPCLGLNPLPPSSLHFLFTLYPEWLPYLHYFIDWNSCPYLKSRFKTTALKYSENGLGAGKMVHKHANLSLNMRNLCKGQTQKHISHLRSKMGAGDWRIPISSQASPAHAAKQQIEPVSDKREE